jgi:predicted DNA-binding protein
MRKDSRMEIRVKLKRDEYERIKKAAEKRGVPIASMVKFVVFKYIEDQEREGKKMWVEDWLLRRLSGQ